MFAMLFGKPEPEEKVFCRIHEPRPLTRFPRNHTRPEPLDDAPETVPQQQVFHTPEPMEQPAPVINPVDHLHSDAPIPIDILRRALPQRFREIDAKARDRAAGAAA